MINSALLNLIETILGRGKILTKPGEISFFCPFCNHYKTKLQINMDNKLKQYGYWKCWVCNAKGRTFHQLFKVIRASRSQCNELNALVGFSPHKKFSDTETKHQLYLPREYQPLYVKQSTPKYNHAITYLTHRNITFKDILKYNLGYCESGKYNNRIIIPSYDGNAQLNFFVGRSFYESKMPYRNCDFPKNIIGFDLFINWDEPIILVEGPYDAMAIKRNVIPLFGKTILSKLKKKIFEKNVKRIYVSLDTDAMKDSLTIVEEFLNSGIEVYLVNLKEGDPSEIGFQKMIQYINDTEETSFSDLMKYKLTYGKPKRYMEIL